MKKIINILSLVAVAAFTLVSCQKEAEKHEPGPQETAGCYGVYFPVQAASGSHVYSPVDDPSIDIVLARTNTSGSITVPIVTSFSENVFTVGAATFADGQDETVFTVRFDNAQEGVTYKASFVIEDNQYASLYNSNAIGLDFDVMRVEMKDFLTEDGSKKAMLTFSDDVFWGEVHDDVYLQYYEVDGIRYCETTGGKLVSPADGSGGIGPWGTDVQLKFKWYTKVQMTVGEGSYDFIEVEPQYHGWDNTTRNSEVWFADYYNYYQANASTPYSGDAIKFFTNNGESYPPCYYDGHGGFVFNLAYYMPTSGGYWYGFKLNAPVAIADGYLRVDYSIKAESDYSDEGLTPVFLTTGVDVASIKYAIYEGELTPTQVGNKVAAIIDGTDESTVFSDLIFDEETAKKYATLLLTPETTGEYTFVAVAYDENGKAQNSASVNFKHIAGDDVEDHKVVLNVFTEDTPARYENYHKYDSFAYGVSGKDLTDVHIGIFKYADVLKNVEGTFNALKKDEKGTYAVSADILAQINSEGGYYTVATKQPAKTELIVLVWATNDDMDDFGYATYTTERLPYKWNSLGTGVYTEDVAGGLYGIGGIDVACNVYEEASTPGLYMIDGFQKNYIGTLFAGGLFGADAVNEDPAEYEGELWRNCELVIDATNASNVIIELQDYGICLNPDEGFVDGLTSLYKGEPFSVGTLENGIIAFPTAKGLLCTLNGEGYYYANQDGAFKVVLPGATSSSVSKTSVTNKSIQPLNLKTFFTRMETPKFERDPKPVHVSVTTSMERKETVKVNPVDKKQVISIVK